MIYKIKKKIKKYWIKKGHDFVLEKDIRSSVPRLTLSLKKGYWVDESVDIYELINNEFEPDKKFTKLRGAVSSCLKYNKKTSSFNI